MMTYNDGLHETNNFFCHFGHLEPFFWALNGHFGPKIGFLVSLTITVCQSLMMLEKVGGPGLKISARGLETTMLNIFRSV